LAFSGREVAGVLDAAPIPIIAVRYSDADPRARHQGVSHHTRAALDATHRAVTVPVPRGAPDPGLGAHRLLEVDVPELVGPLAALGVTSMGRAPAEDPAFWAYAGAAGVAAARHMRA
jgi:hypothetical protein